MKPITYLSVIMTTFIFFGYLESRAVENSTLSNDMSWVSVNIVDGPLPEEISMELKESLGFNSEIKFATIEDYTTLSGIRHIRTQMRFRNLPLKGGLVSFHYSKEGVLKEISGIRVNDIIDEGVLFPFESQVNEKLVNSEELADFIESTDAEIELSNVEKCYIPIRKENTNNIIYELGYNVEFNFGDKLFSAYWDSDFDIREIKSKKSYCTVPPSVQGGNILTPSAYLGMISSPPSYFLMDIGGVYESVDVCRNLTTKLANTLPPGIPQYSSVNIPYEVGLYHWFIANSYDYFESNHFFTGTGGSPITLEIANGGYSANHTYMNSANPHHYIELSFLYSAGEYWDIDVVGHEYGHAVVASTAQLLNGGVQAGDLNESFSDIIGTILEYNALDAIGMLNKFNWNINFHSPGSTPRPIQDPSMISSPETYNSALWNAPGSDKKIVPAFGFYLLSEGNTAPTLNGTNYTYKVDGIGINKASDIFIYALRNYLHPFSSIATLRKPLLKSAEELFGPCSNEYFQTVEMCDAIGLYEHGISNGSNVCPTIISSEVIVNNCSSNPFGGTIALCAKTRTGSSPSYSYNWSGPNGFTSNLSTIAPSHPGEYLVTVTISGCANKVLKFDFNETEIQNQYSTSASQNSMHVGVDVKAYSISPEESMTFKTGYFQGGNLVYSGFSTPDLSPNVRDFYLTNYHPCGDYRWSVYSDNGYVEPVDLETDRNIIGNSAGQVVLLLKLNNNVGSMDLHHNLNGITTTQSITYSSLASYLLLSFDFDGTLLWTHEILNAGLTHSIEVSDLDIDENSPHGTSGSMYYVVGSVAGQGVVQSIDPSGVLHTELTNSSPCALALFQFCHVKEFKTIEADGGEFYVGGNIEPHGNSSSNKVCVVSKLVDNGFSFSVSSNNWFESNVFSELNDIEYSPTLDLLIVAGTFIDEVSEKGGLWKSHYGSNILGDPSNKNVFFFSLRPNSLFFDKSPSQVDYTYYGAIGTHQLVSPNHNALTNPLNVMEIFNPEIHIPESSFIDEFYISGQINSFGGRIVHIHDYESCGSSINESSIEISPRSTYFVSKYIGANCPGIYGITYPPSHVVNTFLRPRSFHYFDNLNVLYGGSDILEPEMKLIVHGSFSDQLKIPLSGINVNVGSSLRLFSSKHNVNYSANGRASRSGLANAAIEPIEANNVIFDAYPNPAREVVYLKANNTGKFTVYSLVGEMKIGKRVIKGEVLKVDIANWATGTYFIDFESGAKRNIKKLVKL